MRALVAGVAAGLVLAAPVPARAARVWGPPAELRTAEGEPIQSPTIAFTSSGELLAAWNPDYRLADGSTPGMRVAARPAGGGTFGPAATIEPGTAPGSQIEVDRHGGAYLTWTRDGGQVMVSYRPQGGPFEPPVNVGHGGAGTSLATNAAGDAVIAFNSYNESSFPDRGRRLYTSFRPSGGDWGPPEAVSDFIPDEINNFGLDVELLPDGSGVYVWEEVKGESSVIKAALRDPVGTISPPVTLSRPGRDSHMPRFATDDDGNGFAVWVDNDGGGASGPVIASYRPAAGPFKQARPIGGFTDWLGPQLGVSDAGEAIVSYHSSTPLPGGGSQLGPPEAALGSTRTGSIGTPTRLVDNRFAFASNLRMNRRGDALVTFFGGGQDVEVVRRAPFGSFGQLEPVRCAPPAAHADGAALAPGGSAVVLSHVDYRPTEMSADYDSGAAAQACSGAGEPPLVFEPVHAKPLRVRARILGRRRLRGGRWLKVVLKCNQPCVVRARGAMKVRGRRKALAFSSARLVIRTAASRRARVGLSRRRARLLKRTPRRRPVHGTLRLKAVGAYGGVRTVTIRRIRR
jgi:hypothetical protein